MRVLITGSSGHLGEGLLRTLHRRGVEVIGLDTRESPLTDCQGSITDPDLVRDCLRGVDFVMHTATLHKPHVDTHPAQAFVDTNVTGTLTILEAAAKSGVSGAIFTSTTSTFGRALSPNESEPAAWITEDVRPVPKNIYGVTKTAAEDLCELVHRQTGLPVIILRTSRFFPEVDDNPELRNNYADLNLKVNELLYRRIDLSDAVEAHLLAAEKATNIGFGRYIISASTPFRREHLRELRTDAPAVVRRLFPDYAEEYDRHGWRMFPGIDRVYVNDLARQELGWQPRYDFRAALESLKAGQSVFSPLTELVGSKGYDPHQLMRYPDPLEEGG